MTKAHQIKPARCKKSATIEEAQKWHITKNFLYEEKYDGRRYLLQIRPNGSKINYLTSRRESVQTGNFVEQQDKLTAIRDYPFAKELTDTILDGEIVGEEGDTSNETATAMVTGKVAYVVWDVIRYRGLDIRDKPLSYRKAVLALLFNTDSLPEWIRGVNGSTDPQRLLKDVRARKGEGIIRKDTLCAYGEGWTKVKEEETEDVIMWGTEPTKSADWKAKGWIGAILIGQWKEVRASEFDRAPDRDKIIWSVPSPGKYKKIGRYFYVFIDCGRCANFTNEVRAAISKKPYAFQGRALEVEYQVRFPSGKFRHPRFLRWRDDKGSDLCIYRVADKE